MNAAAIHLSHNSSVRGNMKKFIGILALAGMLLPSSVPADDTTTTNTRVDSRGNVITQSIETYVEDDDAAAGTGNPTIDSRGNPVTQTFFTNDPGNPFPENDDPQPDEKQTIVNQPNNRRGTSVRMNTSTTVWDPSTSSYVNDTAAGKGNTTIDSRGNIVNQTTETDDEDNPFAEEEEDPWADESRNTRNQNTRGKRSSDTLMDDLNTINNQNQNMQRR
jgi:type II secretory pathway pseudopilin PulG